MKRLTVRWAVPRAYEIRNGGNFVVLGRCCNGSTRVLTVSPKAVSVTCWCGRKLNPQVPRLPSRPLRAVVVPVHQETGWGSVAFLRKVVGTRTVNGQTEILCRYGDDFEKWYPVAA